MGDLGRPQMFSPIRRSSLYFALWRLDIRTLSSTRAGVLGNESAIATAASGPTRHKFLRHADRSGGQEGAVYADPRRLSQAEPPPWPLCRASFSSTLPRPRDSAV